MNKDNLVVGIDDATKCPCIGSIFIAGVAASAATIRKWQSLGVTDSKVVAKSKREELAPIIKATANNYVIDEIRPETMADNSLNLNAWEMLTVLSIVSRLPGNTVYVDNWEVSGEHFSRRMAFLLSEPKVKDKGFAFNTKELKARNFIAEHRADENYIVVGAASILAKVASDAQYDAYRKQYGDFGSGSPADPRTRLFVWRHRHNPLPIIRTSWQTYKHLSGLERIEDDWLYAKVKKKPYENKRTFESR